MKKRIRNVATPQINKEIQALLDMREPAKLLKVAMQSFPDLKSLDEINIYLKEKTGFENITMASDSLNLKAQYTIISRYIDLIDFSKYDDDLVHITPEARAEIQENNTRYWSEEEVKEFVTIEKMLDKLNKMNIPLGSIRSDHRGKFSFNEKHWSVAKQLSASSRNHSLSK